MTKKLLLRLSFGSFLLSSLLYFVVPPAIASWLGEWDKRVKITINSAKINATLTNFPVLIHLSANSGENAEDVSFVFDKLQSDANRKKIAVTTGDGTNQCYVEIEDWVHTNEQAWLWAKVPGIASNTDTELYLYYDTSQSNNDTYVGDPNDAVAENVWDDNYVMVQHLSETSGNTYDSTSNNNDGTVYPVTFAQNKWIAGKRGNALNYDVSDDLIKVENEQGVPATPSNGSFTVEAWIYPKSDGEGSGWDAGRIIKRAYGQIGWSLTVANQTNNIVYLFLNVQLDNTDSLTQTSTGVSTGAWHHVLATFNAQSNKKGRIYIDGTEANYSTQTVGIGNLYNDTAGACDIHIGNHDQIRTFDGYIDDVRFYNRAISEAEITYSYNGGDGADPSNTTDLVGWWKMDETSGDVAADSSGNGYDGDLYGYPPVTATAKVDSALNFDGFDDYVKALDSSSLDISGSYTLEAWIYPANVNKDFQGIIAKRNGANAWNYQLILYYDELYFSICMGADPHITTNANFAGNTWYHCVTVFDDVNDLAKIYVNGIEKLSGSETNSPVLDDNPVRLGDLGYGVGSYFFGGIIDEPRISDIVRNPAWIKACYETQRDNLLDFGKEKSRLTPGIVFSIK